MNNKVHRASKRIYVSVDVEADGPCPGIYSMVSLGAVAMVGDDESRWPTFYAQFSPISDIYVPEALAVSQHTREECEQFPSPTIGMTDFAKWLEGFSNPLFVSDNNGFDWQFVNYYFHRFLGSNPFGHSSHNIGSHYKGAMGKMNANFKRLRRTKHTHHPVDDARGNAEAFKTILDGHAR